MPGRLPPVLGWYPSGLDIGLSNVRISVKSSILPLRVKSRYVLPLILDYYCFHVLLRFRRVLHVRRVRLVAQTLNIRFFLQLV